MALAPFYNGGARGALVVPPSTNAGVLLASESEIFTCDLKFFLILFD